MSPGKKIAIVTGAHGFLGRHLASHYSGLGFEVHGMGHGRWAAGEAQHWGLASWVETDIHLEAMLTLKAKRPLIIAHCAGGSSVSASLADPAADYQRTVVTTEQVLEAARRQWPEAHIVFPSSGAVYGVAPHQPIREDAPTNPVSVYGQHKLAAEKLCLDYAAKHGLFVAVVRMFSVYGEGLQKQLLWDACSKVARGMYEFFGTGSETRDWLHVSDAITLLQLAVDFADQDCPTVNGGTGELVTNREVLEAVCRAFGTTERPRFNGDSRPGDPQHYTADTTMARLWNWHPLVEMHDGIDRYVRWFKSEAL